MNLPTKPYIIYVGNLYPHKNIPVLVAAVESLNKNLPAGRQVNLAIVCARSVFESRLPKSQYIHYLGRLSDSDLIKAYKNSLAFVTPSLIEGFGLPGLEAMASSTPVIAANASCLPEIYGDAALYFDPHSPQDLVEKIQNLFNNPKLKQKLITNSKKQVARYSWAKMASQTWQIYQSVLQ